MYLHILSVYFKSAEWPLVYQLDITKPNEISQCVEDLKSRSISVNVLISNAGISQRGTIEDTIIDVHRNLMNVNYFGQVNLVKGLKFWYVSKVHSEPC